MKPQVLFSFSLLATVLLLPAVTPEAALAQLLGPVKAVVSLSGKVLMEDGAPPPQQATIERICGTVVRPETRTDAKGNFSFQLGGNQYMTTDASTRNEQSGSVFDRGTAGSNDPVLLSERDLMNCVIRASLTGYVSDVIPLAGRKLYDRPDIGAIILHRPAKVEGTTVSAVSASAPQDARRAFDSAQGKIRNKQFAEARKDLEKAVQIYPQYATAWNDLGTACLQLGDVAAGRNAFLKSAEADPKFVIPLVQLTDIAVRQRQFQEAVDAAGRVAKLDPVNFPGVYYMSAVASYSLQNYEAAEKSAREAVRIDEQHRYPKAHHLLGALLGLKRDYAGAAEQLKMYLQLAPGATDAAAVKQQLAEVERMAQAGGAAPQ
jgi:tetratricopeptide (TPR) repeat protein